MQGKRQPPPSRTLAATRLLSDGAILVPDGEAMIVTQPGSPEWWRALTTLDNDLHTRAVEAARQRGLL
jgi:hypothetical protein